MSLAKLYADTLLNDILPFWEAYSLDEEFGGYYTCLTRTGQVYDTDKFIWLQGRQVWTFAMLYNQLEQRDSWLATARLGAEFLKKYGSDAGGNFYFSVDRSGMPLVQPYSIFSDCFAAMAFSQYGKATGDDEYIALARSTYQNILRRSKHPKGKYEKSTGNRPLIGFALPMILSNLVLELEEHLDASEVETRLNDSVAQVMDVFLQKDTGLIHESVLPGGETHDSFEGRLINPGHGIEAMWFMMDIGARRGDGGLIRRAANAVVNTLDYAWDQKYGGIFYFLDSRGRPPQQLEWDQKLWWVHLEALVALAKAYEHTGDEIFWQWYHRVHEYTWARFPDPDTGEWFAYLNRRGEPFLTLKGGKWKGCFHVPRAMWQCAQIFKRISS